MKKQFPIVSSRKKLIENDDSEVIKFKEYKYEISPKVVEEEVLVSIWTETILIDKLYIPKEYRIYNKIRDFINDPKIINKDNKSSNKEVKNKLMTNATLKISYIIENLYKGIYPIDFIIDIGSAPGGLSYYLLKDQKVKRIEAISIEESKGGLSFFDELKSFENFKVIKGDGDSTKFENIEKISENASILVGDATFEIKIESESDFIPQDVYLFNLIISEIYISLLKVDWKNKFSLSIIKIFGTSWKPFLVVLYIITKIFKTVRIEKPTHSRPSNSEKYLVYGEMKDIQALELGKKLLKKALEVPKDTYLSFDQYYNDIFSDERFTNSIKKINDHFLNIQLDKMTKINKELLYQFH